jgi:membrane protein YdbS with pleckstrin-like domain
VKTPAQSPEIKDSNVQPTDAQKQAANTVFEASPSIWCVFPAFLKTILIVAFLIFVSFWPIRQILVDFNKIPQNVIDAFLKYRPIVGVCLAALVMLRFAYKVLKLKSIHYRITVDRVEWSRGIFERRVDNIDMFRIVDIRLCRSIVDYIVGIGEVVLVTSDKTDPEFRFEKIRRPKQLYEIIKKSSLDADTKRGVIHLE